MTSRTALWKAIQEALTSDIARGLYAPGDKLPTEAQLAVRFGVNRHTVRRALAGMAEQGVVYSRRGAGVFVELNPTDYPIGQRVRFHQNLSAAGRVPGKEILSIETRHGSEAETAALGLSSGAKVHICEGISTSDGQPMALFQSSFCATRFPSLPEVLRHHSSITAALREVGVLDYTRASTRLQACLADARQAVLLRLSEGAPLLRAKAINVDEHSYPVEYGRTWFAGDRVVLTVGEEDETPDQGG